MLHIDTSSTNASKTGLQRRGFLQLGGLGIGALALPDLLRLRAAGAAPTRPKSVILVWLAGGPS
ncbi:MAG: DUF1501 domain-containing protein, partial [Planctomycetota bacterium]